MKRFLVLLMVFCMLTVSAGAAFPDSLVLNAPAENWSDSYLSFLDSHYDTLAGLWPDGLGGIGFIDLDLDGTPEMILFDQGASMAMGASLFDLVNGQVSCVSSGTEGAGSALSGGSLSGPHVDASFFEAFRLSWTENGWCFWIDSTNGTMESTWNEIVRFDSAGGVLTPASVCKRFLRFDPATGVAVEEDCSVAGVAADGQQYSLAERVYTEGQDAGYEAKGTYCWEDSAYTASRDGMMAMARAAVESYVPITSAVSVASLAG